MGDSGCGESQGAVLSTGSRTIDADQDSVPVYPVILSEARAPKPCRYTSSPDGCARELDESQRLRHFLDTQARRRVTAPVPPTSFGATKTWNSSAALASRNEPSRPAPPSTSTFVNRRRPRSARRIDDTGVTPGTADHLRTVRGPPGEPALVPRRGVDDHRNLAGGVAKLAPFGQVAGRRHHHPRRRRAARAAAR